MRESITIGIAYGDDNPAPPDDAIGAYRIRYDAAEDAQCWPLGSWEHVYTGDYCRVC